MMEQNEKRKIKINKYYNNHLQMKIKIIMVKGMNIKIKELE